MNATAIIRLRFSKREHLSAIFEALQPETRTIVTSRSKVMVKKEDHTLTLIFQAKDTSALRAALNSYLYWIRLTKDALDMVEAFDSKTVSRNT